MAIMTTGTLPFSYEYVDPAVRDFWDDGAGYSAVYRRIFKDVAISEQIREDIPRAGLGKFSATVESGDVNYDALVEGKKGSARLVQYHAGFAVTEAARRFKTDIALLQAGVKALKNAREVTVDSIAADLLNNGFLTTKYTYRDGLAFFSTAHPYIRDGAGTGSNRSANGTDIAEASIEQAITDIKGMKTNEGFPATIMPDMAVIPVGQEFNWTRATKSMQITGSANNDTNALRTLGYMQSQPVEWKLLSSSKAWFVMNKGAPEDGWIMYHHSEDSDTPVTFLDQKNGTTYVRMVMFRVGYFKDWRAMYANSGGAVVV